MEINAGQSIHLLNQTGNTQMQANTVSLHTANGMNIQGDKSVTLQVGNHSLQATEAGDLILSAKHITFSAKQNIHLANTTSSINSSSASSIGNAQLNQTVMQQTFSSTPPFTACKPKKLVAPTVIPSATAAPVADEGSNNATAGSGQENTTSPTQQSQPFPSVSFDLSLIPEMQGVIAFEGKPFLYKANLSGTVSLKKAGMESPVDFSVNDYKIEARSTLSHFFGNLSLHPTSHTQMMLGSEITGDFVTTSVMAYFANRIHFEASPQPIEKAFSGWSIEGNLAFTLDLISQNPPPNGLPASQHAAWHQQEWHNIGNVALAAGVIALGITLSPVLEGIALAGFIVSIT